MRTGGSKISKIAFSSWFPCEEQGGRRILSPQLSWDILVNITELEVAGANFACGQEVHSQLHGFKKTMYFDGLQGILVTSSG